MDRRTLLAITLCFGIFMAWQKFYIEPQMAQQPTAPAVQVAQNPTTPTAPTTIAPETSKATIAPGEPQKSRPAISLPLTTGTGAATIGDSGKMFKDWKLRDYRVGLTKETAAIDLGQVTHQTGEVEMAFDDASLAYLSGIQGELKSSAQGVIWTYEDANVKLTRELNSNADLPYVDARFTAEFKTKRPAYTFISIANQMAADKDPEEQDRQLVYFTNDSIERVTLADATKLQEVITPVKYVGATSRYFLFALIAQGPAQPKGLIQPVSANAARINMVYPVSGNSISIPLRVYFGPKELNTLRSVEPALDHTVDFGWFTIFAYPILKFMKWLYHYVGNYGIAIILLTLILKVLTYPLTYKSMKSMKEMARLQPQLQKLREKHKDDKEALNREMLTMMKSHGYNPMAGCLPILVQMPIFFALYRVLYSSIDLYHAPFGFWIQDLSAHDPLYVTPVLMSVTMFIQQKLMPNTATDPMQAKMIQFMPLIFGAFMLALPAGLTLYMLVNALASIAQQLILNKKLDTGNVAAMPARAR